MTAGEPIITEGQALNYEIFSSSLVGSWFQANFFWYHKWKCKRKYKRYIEAMKFLGNDKSHPPLHPPTIIIHN